MAPHARMLYPPNATACLLDCSDACSFHGLCGPPLYAPPPPPQQNPTSPIRLHHSSRLSLALVASASSLAAACLILLLSCLLSLHLRSRRRRRSASSAAAAAGGGGGGGVVDAGGFVDEDGEVDHHVWYIRTVGLDEPTIGAITVCVYRSGEGGVLVGGGGGGEGGCAVCLAEFRDGELLRLLPKCGHAFHVACIDAWLRGHVNCPLCRAPIMAPTPAPAPADALPSLSPSLSPSSSSSSSSDSTISDHDGSDSSNQAEVRGIEEEPDAGDVEIGGDNAIEVNSTVELSSSSSRVLSNSQSQDKV